MAERRGVCLLAVALVAWLHAGCASEPAPGAGAVDRAAEPVRGMKLVVPPRLRSSGLEGYVVVRYTIDATGAVVDPVVVESLPGAFDELTLASVQKMQFRPRLVAGVPVATPRIEIFPFCNATVRGRGESRPEVCRGPRNRAAFAAAVLQRHPLVASQPQAGQAAEGGDTPAGAGDESVNPGTPEATPAEAR